MYPIRETVPKVNMWPIVESLVQRNVHVGCSKTGISLKERWLTICLLSDEDPRSSWWTSRLLPAICSPQPCDVTGLGVPWSTHETIVRTHLPYDQWAGALGQDMYKWGGWRSHDTRLVQSPESPLGHCRRTHTNDTRASAPVTEGGGKQAHLYTIISTGEYKTRKH